METKNSWSRFIGGILLVSGTTIGAGILALPVATGIAGFFPSLFLFIIYWAFMMTTALLMLEVNLWMGEHANLISMAHKTLGNWGRAFSWVVYLFLLYALTTAYLAGSGPIFFELVSYLFNVDMPVWVSPLPLLIIFGLFVYKGTRSVDYANRFLMLGLVVSYLFLIGLLTPHVNTTLLHHVDWKALTLGVSVVATSFGFHVVIPSLTTYLGRDVKKLRAVIIIGSIIPLVVYIIWQWVALGILPIDGPNGLAEGYVKGTNGAYLLSVVLGHHSLAFLTTAFSFFAIVTSFLGVSLSLNDFLADGFKIKKTRPGRMMLYVLTFLPPLMFVWTDPRAFLSALEFAGAFGVALLLGLLPALMVWRGRYTKHFDSPYKVPGGKWTLVACIVLSILVVVIEIINRMSSYVS